MENYNIENQLFYKKREIKKIELIYILLKEYSPV